MINLKALKELHAKSTPGKWEWTEDNWHGGYSGICGPVVNGACVEVLYPDHCNEGDDGAAWFEYLPSEADREMLVEGHNVMPDLIDWIEKVVSFLSSHRDALSEACHTHCSPTSYCEKCPDGKTIRLIDELLKEVCK